MGSNGLPRYFAPSAEGCGHFACSLAEVLEGARREARSSFGDDRVLIERRIAFEEIAGVAINVPFLSRLVADPEFRAGDFDTGFIECALDTLTSCGPAPERRRYRTTPCAIAEYPVASPPKHPLKGCRTALWQLPGRSGSRYFRGMARKRADYRPRIADAELAELLAASGAVLVEGARAVGKTATAMQASASHVLLDVDLDARRMMSIDPAAVLTGDTPRLLDEWQLAREVWNHVRRTVDERSGRGQFILTGSAVPADDVTRHTGAGRFTRLRMRPMSLFESGHSTGAISLRGLLDGEPQRGHAAPVPIAQLAERIAVGGWPAHLGSAAAPAMRVNRGYLDDIRRTDVSRLDGRPRDPVRIGRLLQSLARNLATPVSVAKLAADVGGSGTAMKADTAAGYLDALERLMVVEHQPAWSPHLRSRTTLRSTPVRHFVDPSLAVAALGGRASPATLAADLGFFGFLFESMVIRDLRIYAQAADAAVFHYREKDGLEVDAVVEAADGRWAAFEIKLGDRWVDDGARNLRRLAKRMANSDHGPPAALAVIVPSGYGFAHGGTEAGVIPIHALGP